MVPPVLSRTHTIIVLACLSSFAASSAPGALEQALSLGQVAHTCKADVYNRSAFKSGCGHINLDVKSNVQCFLMCPANHTSLYGERKREERGEHFSCVPPARFGTKYIRGFGYGGVFLLSLILI